MEAYTYSTGHTEALDTQLYNFINKHDQAVSLVLAAALPNSY